MRPFPKPWSRQRRLLALFAVVTLLPAVGLVWLGITLIGQDRELAEKQLRDHLEREVDAVAAAIASDLARPAGATEPRASGAHSAVVPASVWKSGQDAEDRGQFDVAVSKYERLAHATDRRIRAEALIRLGRVLRRTGKSNEALVVWDQLKDMDDVRVFDEPASLQAALARVRELNQRGRVDIRDREAGALRNDLRRARWPIDPVTLETAWSQVTEAAMLSDTWRTRWSGAGLVVSLTDPAGVPILPALPLVEPIARRSPAESGLPWTIRVASSAPEIELARFGSRRRDLLLLLALAAFLVFAGAYFVARGIRRELAVAELQSSFVSAVSHEFRTPLTSMSHLIELLRDRSGMDEARRAKYYDALEQEAGRLRRFVDQLLAFGRVDAGAAQYRFEPTRVNELVERVVDQFRGGPSAKGHAVASNTDLDLPDVALDHLAFALALNNLLENAAKYSPGHTPIHVDLQKDAIRRRILVQVRDEGLGIPVFEHQIIFDKFVRGAAAQASGVRGTGVGLALARDIIRAHGGDISVESEVGKGSTFSIVLPITGQRKHGEVRSTNVDVQQ